MSLGRPTSALAGAVAATLLLTGPAAAVTFDFILDAGQSSLGGNLGSAALSGTGQLQLGQVPPLAANTTFDAVDLAVTGGGLTITLDGDFANPGLGVLRPDQTFLIPTLLLRIDDGLVAFDLTVSNVAGSFGPSAACGGGPCLETSFQIDSLGPQGILDVALVANATPEPAVPLLLALGAVGLAGWLRGTEESS